MVVAAVVALVGGRVDEPVVGAEVDELWAGSSSAASADEAPCGSARKTRSASARCRGGLGAKTRSATERRFGCTSPTRWPALPCAVTAVTSRSGCAATRRSSSPPAYPLAPAMATRYPMRTIMQHPANSCRNGVATLPPRERASRIGPGAGGARCAAWCRRPGTRTADAGVHEVGDAVPRRPRPEVRRLTRAVAQRYPFPDRAVLESARAHPVGRCHPPGGALRRDCPVRHPLGARTARSRAAPALPRPDRRRRLVGPRRRAGAPGRRAARGLAGRGRLPSCAGGRSRTTSGCAGSRSSASSAPRAAPTSSCCAPRSRPTQPRTTSSCARRSAGRCATTHAPIRTGCAAFVAGHELSPLSRREALKHL